MPLDMSKPTLQQIGNYDVLSKIAEGGMGAVYKGRNRDTGMIVAIKVLPATTAANPVLVEALQTGIQRCKQTRSSQCRQSDRILRGRHDSLFGNGICRWRIARSTN